MTIRNKKILFLGIGGVSMHNLALAYRVNGNTIMGYDHNRSRYTDMCERAGIKVSYRFDKKLLDVDICIKTPAIQDDNRFVVELIKRGIRIIDRAEALGELCGEFGCVIAVAGTHGKSTTSALIYSILSEHTSSVSCHIGADVENDRFCLGDDYLVVEACEYNKSFLALKYDYAVVTNAEMDHMDTYGNMFNLRNAFLMFVKRAKFRFAYDCGSNKFLHKIKNINFVSKLSKPITSNLTGEYNHINISLAIAVCKDLGISDDEIARGVRKFVGLPRRNEYIGKYFDAECYIDYAHHPTEIENFCTVFLDGGNQIVFQPHTYSRTKYLLHDFIRVLSKIDNLIIYKEFPAREKSRMGISSKQLYEILKTSNTNVKYANNIASLSKYLVQNGKIAFVGAGDIADVGKKLITKK